jgi:hypothetical protein
MSNDKKAFSIAVIVSVPVFLTCHSMGLSSLLTGICSGLAFAVDMTLASGWFYMRGKR